MEDPSEADSQKPLRVPFLYFMALRDDIRDYVATEVQHFRKEPLTQEELAQIYEDVSAFCIIEIKKYCGEEVFNEKNSRFKRG